MGEKRMGFPERIFFATNFFSTKRGADSFLQSPEILFSQISKKGGGAFFQEWGGLGRPRLLPVWKRSPAAVGRTLYRDRTPEGKGVPHPIPKKENGNEASAKKFAGNIP